MGKTGKEPAAGGANRGGRPDSPTGASDSSREARLCSLHRRLLSAWPHQPHVAFLEAEDKDPSQPGFIVGVEAFLAPHECDAMVECINAVGLNPPSPKDLHPKKGEAFLCRESFAFEDPALGAALFQRMKPFLPVDVGGRVPVGLTPRLRYYRYLKGHSFGKHVDQSIKDPLLKGSDGSSAETEFTALIYLNSASVEHPPLLAGGEVRWRERGREGERERGMRVLGEARSWSSDRPDLRAAAARQALPGRRTCVRVWGATWSIDIYSSKYKTGI
jgi:hypothetical protein